MKHTSIVRFLCVLVLCMPLTAHAGLLDKLMDSRVGDDYTLSAVPFDFSAAMENPASIAKDYLNTYQTTSIKGVKRVIIPSFQVRFCMQDDATKTIGASGSGGGMSWSWSKNAFAGVDVKMSAELRQKLTDLLYERFVKQLNSLGIEVVTIDPAMQMNEVQEGIKATPANGAVETLYTFVGRETKQEQKAKSSFSYPWSIHHPTKTTTLSFSGVMEGGAPGQSWARMAERPVIPPSMIKVAKKLGAGIVMAGYEVRVAKMDAQTEKGSGLFGKPKPVIKAEPVLRTRLLGFKVMPENGNALVMAIGMSGGSNFVGMNFDGLGVQPVASALPFGGSKLGNYPWVELAGSYGGLRGTGTDGAWIIEPDPAKLEADFAKVMDAQMMLLFSMIKQAD